MKFKDLKFIPHKHDSEGIRTTHFFDNDYGVSVVRFLGSYGYDQGLYELAVLKRTENSCRIFYEYSEWYKKNPELKLYLYYQNFIHFCDEEVFGYLTPKQVESIMSVVENVKS